MRTLIMSILASTLISCGPPKDHGYICKDHVKGNVPDYVVEVSHGVTPFDANILHHDCIYAARWPEYEDYQYNVAYSVHFKNLKKGDVVLYTADAAAANGSSGSVLFAWYTDVSTIGMEDVMFTPNHTTLSAHPAMGFNITPTDEGHYGTASDSGVIAIQQDYDDLWLNFVVYAGYSDQVGGNSEWLKVFHSGGLTGVVIR